MTSELIKKSVALVYGVTVEEMLEKVNWPKMVRARHTCIALMREASFSYPEIAKEMGRDKATIMNQSSKHDDRMITEPNYSKTYKECKSQCYVIDKVRTPNTVLFYCMSLVVETTRPMPILG